MFVIEEIGVKIENPGKVKKIIFKEKIDLIFYERNNLLSFFIPKKYTNEKDVFIYKIGFIYLFLLELYKYRDFNYIYHYANSRYGFNISKKKTKRAFDEFIKNEFFIN